MPTGTWSIDATVDGAPCGSFSFEIVDSDARPAAAARRPLSPAEIFGRLQDSFAEIERSIGGPLKTDPAAAFLLQPGILATAFAAIDGADGLQMTVPRGQRREVTSVVAWNRRQDWALLATTSTVTPLAVATAPATPGDRCYSMQAGAGGARVLAEGAVIGKADGAGGGRLIVSFENGDAAPGAPVVNEFGEVIGLVGGSLTFGKTSLIERLAARRELHGVAVVPVAAIVVPGSPSPATLAELRQRGVTIPPAVAEVSVMQSGFARDVDSSMLRSPELRSEFTAADKRFFAFVRWDPKERMRGQMRLRVYDAENRLVIESKPGKADLKPGSITLSRWQLTVPAQAGEYRADVVLDERTLWRGFFKVR
jgi:hypothetical protein